MPESLYRPRRTSAVHRILRGQPQTHGQAWLLSLACSVVLLAILAVEQWSFGFGWSDKFTRALLITYPAGFALIEGSALSFRLHRRRKKARAQAG